ncbi:MAG: hypothetical protein Q9183_001173 [Haloplaca sp. 2 TL-2023]
MPKGCRAGNDCRFLHDSPTPVGTQHTRSNLSNVADSLSNATTTSTAGENSSLSAAGADGNTGGQQHVRRYEPPPVDASRIVQKPISRLQRESPREFQIRQLERRFATQRTAGSGESILEFLLIPSDPDFPFEMTGLECVLHVPTQYPASGKAFLSVRNGDMPRGYQINVERGFDSLVSSSPRATLLSLLNTLDKQLEVLLTQEKAQTIKLVPARANGQRKEHLASATANAVGTCNSEQPRVGVSIHTPEQLRVAQTRRQAEVTQLQARLGRHDVFSTSPDGITFTVPINPRRLADLTVPLQAVRSVHLIVPSLYPLESCRIAIPGVNRESAGKVERVFYARAKANADMNLMAHLNYLSQNVHEMAREPVEEAAVLPEDSILALDPTSPKGQKAAASQQLTKEDEDRNHIKIIPRPPEWTLAGEEESDSDGDGDGDSDFSDSYDSGDESENTHEDAEQPGLALETPNAQSAERGIALSLPSLELHNIELLELTSVSLSVKCSRCKTLNDISNLRPSDNRSDSCSKCTQPFSLAFRPELMHINSFRAGYVDLTACTIADMLPSTFNPTCSTCSTRVPNPGVISVRGDASSMAICRDCHSHMSFKIPETKFMLISNTSLHPRHLLPLRRKKPKESLGIVAGQELPRRGRCKHYGKSYRWFRFSCCSKVYACDKCHDDAEGHPNEHANRMICGFCSREQNYRPEECGLCRMSVVGKKGTGFWEGGKGTRDKAKMSRKDPRKYKRRAGTRVGGAKKGGTGGGGETAKKT